MKTDDELSGELYQIARLKGTEPAFTGKYWNHHESGDYRCAICDNLLFSSGTKFDSGTGWPSFTDPANQTNIKLQTDDSHGMTRIEVICKQCGAHLGHLFEDGPQEKGGRRYCINSTCLTFRQKH